MSRKAWNQLATEFEQSVCDITASNERSIARFVAQTKPSRRKTLVDAGCGIGTFSARFGRQFRRIVGFDFASSMVRRARKRCNQLPACQWHTLALENAAAKFGAIGDLVVCLNVITSPNPTLRLNQWQSLAGLVRPGGHMLVVVPSLESARHVVSCEETAFNESEPQVSDLVQRRDTEQKHYSRYQLKKRIVWLGLEVLSVRKVPYSCEEDGLEEDSGAKPWDWGCLAQRRDDTSN